MPMMQWLLTAFLFFGLSDWAHAQELKIHSALDVMVFEDTYECGGLGKPHESYCQAMDFKPWTEEEKQIVSQYLANINDPRLRGFLKKIKDSGFTKIYRVNHFSKFYNNTMARRTEYFRTADSPLLQVDPVTRVVSFSNTFFKSSAFVDPWTKLDRRQAAVLHELVHVFDTSTGNHASDDKGFKDAIGWTWDGQNWGLRDVSTAQIQKEVGEVLTLVKVDAPAAYLLDRQLGRKYGYPTIYGLLNSHELFAEVLTYYIFDPTAESYLSKEVVDHIKSVLQERP